jgi:Zn-dependent metalloprotease
LYTKKIKKKEDQEAARQSYIVHLGSGVFNRVFYLISNSPDWDPKKAFGVMVQANSNYWTETSDYAQAACGVLKATKDFNYNTSVVTKAFDKVGLNTRECH